MLENWNDGRNLLGEITAFHYSVKPKLLIVI
jgi:hypothetical protein